MGTVGQEKDVVGQTVKGLGAEEDVAAEDELELLELLLDVLLLMDEDVTGATTVPFTTRIAPTMAATTNTTSRTAETLL